MGAINLGSRNAGAIFGGAALMLMAGLVPSILQAIGHGFSSSPILAWVIPMMAVGYWLFVMMPLGAGFYQLIHATETGRPTRAMSIFEVFRDTPMVLRMAGLGLSVILLVFIIGLVMRLLLGQDFVAGLAGWIQALGTIDQQNPVLPPAPEKLGVFVAMSLLFGMFFGGVYMLAFGQAALGDGKLSGALKDGLIGAFKNVLPLLLVSLLCLVMGAVGLVVFVLVVGLLVVVGSLVNAGFGPLIMLPVYFGWTMLVYVIAYGVGYFMWRDVCSGQEVVPGRGHHVTL